MVPLIEYQLKGLTGHMQGFSVHAFDHVLDRTMDTSPISERMLNNSCLVMLSLMQFEQEAVVQQPE